MSVGIYVSERDGDASSLFFPIPKVPNLPKDILLQYYCYTKKKVCSGLFYDSGEFEQLQMI